MRVLYICIIGAIVAGLSFLMLAQESTKRETSDGRDASAVERTVFPITYEQGTNRESENVADLLQGSKLIGDVAKTLGATFKLEHDIPVIFENCEEITAAYDDKRHRLSLCYELFESIRRVFASNASTAEQELDQEMINAAAFVLLHQLGHVIVAHLQLSTPISEDGLDDLSVLLLLQGKRDTALPLLRGMLQLARSAEKVELSLGDLPYWDQHALETARVYEVACLIYGSAPDRYSAEIDPALSSRFAECAEEYLRKLTSWTTIIQTHVQEENRGE
jgi:hypothetical protein